MSGGDVVRAAGAVLWRHGPDGQPEVALVHRPKYDDWSLPKGKLDPGEHVLRAAIREVEEETGHRMVLGRRLPPLHYRVDGRPKVVDYWAGRAHGGAFVPNREVDVLAWLPLLEATRRLTWERDVAVLDAFADGPVETTPLLLLRHASALPRSEWDADDQTRPLSDQGEAQSSALGPLLDCFGLERVLTSDTRRTVDTVRPFADRHGLTLELEPLVSQQGFSAHADAALDRARSLLRCDVATVVCTHRPVLPWLATTLCERSGIAAPTDMLDPGDFWVMHLAGGRVVAVERHGPRET